MLAALVIVFREVLEAGLIVGVVLAASRGVSGRGRAVALGILAGAAGSLVVAAFAAEISAAFDGRGQELFTAAVLALAVVMLTSAGTVVDRIVGLEMGADDYLPKPFDPRELLARLKSVLRRTSHAASADLGAERVRIGKCVLDVASHRLMDDEGNEVPMSPLEFDLLKALARHPNHTLSRERILNLTQQREWDPFDRSVDLRVMRLRKKIEPDPEHPRYIRTVRNVGYVFVPGGERSD